MSIPIYRFLDTIGDGTGTKDAAVNGAVTPVVFKYVPNAGDRTQLHRMIVQYEDTAGFTPNEYGNLGTTLTNGIAIQIRDTIDDRVVLDLTDSLNIKNNHDWGRSCYDFRLNDFGVGQATESINVRWTFARSGMPLYLQDNEHFAVVIQDNLTGLLEQFFMVQGFIEDKT